MRKSVFALITVVLFTLSCSRDGGGNGGDGEPREAPGHIFYGGTFRLNEVTDFRNLFPLSIDEVVSQRVASQVYEGLVKLSQRDLTIEPSIAERWEVSDDATSYTFYIRKGVKFHDNACFPEGKGREVNANDFKYCFERLCTADASNKGFYMFKGKIKGSQEYYDASKAGQTPEKLEGVTVIDEYTLRIDLNYPFAGFLNILSTQYAWLYPKEAWDKYGVDMREKCIGTGPFKVQEIKPGTAVVLERNSDYWGKDEHGNQLPYLDKVKITFLKQKKSELMEFRKKKLDMVFEIPSEEVDNVLVELDMAKKGGNVPFKLQVEPALNFQYYGFQMKSEEFSNVLVRKAFNYAINRKEILKYTLQGQGTEAWYGIVPPSLEGYDTHGIKGYKFDPKKARELMAEAGFENGKGFPEIVLNINDDGGRRNEQVALVIQKMLKENLGVTMKIEVLPFASHLDKVENGKAVFWRAGWTADYPDPEAFLSLFYGADVPETMDERSNPNTTRYQNAEFDSLFNMALREVDYDKRNELYKMADQVAISDAVIIPLLYDENFRLLQLNVRNLDANAMEYRNLSMVYFQPEPKKD